MLILFQRLPNFSHHEPVVKGLGWNDYVLVAGHRLQYLLCHRSLWLPIRPYYCAASQRRRHILDLELSKPRVRFQLRMNTREVGAPIVLQEDDLVMVDVDSYEALRSATCG